MPDTVSPDPIVPLAPLEARLTEVEGQLARALTHVSGLSRENVELRARLDHLTTWHAEDHEVVDALRTFQTLLTQDAMGFQRLEALLQGTLGERRHAFLQWFRRFASRAELDILERPIQRPTPRTFEDERTPA